ncbi:MAG: hypothetical protein U5K69_30280 [Balneolaceae bacterium]|nr:hypothetical protein [Balneolaceae bacterium]
MEHATRDYELRCVAKNHLNSENETTTYCTECDSVLKVQYAEPHDYIQYPLEELRPEPLKTSFSALKKLDRLSETYRYRPLG